MNRMGLGLAVGAGYVLGRTKKMKLAVAVGSMVAGKRMHLNPKALADLASQQLQDNPQLKEIGDQLRGELRGVGKAASGALVERQIEGLADRLHGRTAAVRDQLSGVTSNVPGLGDEEEPDEVDAEDVDEADVDAEDEESGERDANDEYDEESDEGSDKETEESESRRRNTAGKKSAPKRGPAKPAARKSAMKKAPAKKTAAAKTTARKGTQDAGGERRRGR